tara:strand:- start:448 stop:1629 length:1182 start_codon:yes stop_codon:yes gene_type:complete
MILCNTCGSDEIDHLFNNKIRSTARLNNVPYKVYICKKCGHVFLDYSFLKQVDLENYYKINNPFEKVEELDLGHQKVRSEQIDFVLDNIGKNIKNLKFLDIGCGSGFFLYLLKQKGYYCEGVERSNMMCEMINKHYNIKCTNTSFEELEIQNTFDVVSIITVIEHLFDPKKCLLKIRKLIKDDGFLFIEIPDTQLPRFDILPDYLAFEHLHHWTIDTIKNLLNICGFEICSFEQKRNDDDSGNPENVLRVLAKKVNIESNPKITNNYNKLYKNLKDFKLKHDDFINSFKIKIKNLLKKVDKEKVNIYCAGLHTNALISTFPELKDKIKDIYDSDLNLSNTIIENFSIKSSKLINKETNKNFIMSTTNHEHTIYNFLKSINSEFKVFGLYNDFD